MIVTSVGVVTTKFLFGMCDCTVGSGVGTGNLSIALGFLHMCGQAHLQSHVAECLDLSHHGI